MALYDLTLNEIQEYLKLEPYRARQVVEFMYKHLGDLSKASALPKNVLNQIAGDPYFQTSLKLLKLSQCDNGQTHKFLFELNDHKLIESVLMQYHNRSSVCISTQSGCKMNCSFCATGQMGFKRNLTKGEIVEQVITLMRFCLRNNYRPVTNLVFMGMGEPLDNYENTVSASWTIKNDLNLGAKHITISTVGIVPAIESMADDNLPFRLAVSLHGADNETRSRIVPINKKYPIETLVAALKKYLMASGSRRISLEWTLIEGTNDSIDQAIKLSKIAKDLKAHVNLIYLNPTKATLNRPTDKNTALAFKSMLDNHGINCTLRRTRGQSIDAACGQLASIN